MTSSDEEEKEVDWNELRGAIDSDKTSVEMEKELWNKID